AVTTVAASLSKRLSAAEAAAGGALKGRVNHSVCKWCYPKVALEDLCKAGKEMGLQSVELLTYDQFPTLKKYDMLCAMVSGADQIRYGLNRCEPHAPLVQKYEESPPRVAEVGLKNIFCFPGTRRGMSDEQGLENCVLGIRRVLP